MERCGVGERYERLKQSSCPISYTVTIFRTCDCNNMTRTQNCLTVRVTIEWHNVSVKSLSENAPSHDSAQVLIRQRAGIVGIFASIALIAIILRALPAGSDEIRNTLHHLNFAPLIVAGLLYGWRAATAATMFAFLAESLNFLRTLRASAFDAIDLLVELAI